MGNKDTTDKALGDYLVGQATGAKYSPHSTMGADQASSSSMSAGSARSGDASGGVTLILLFLLPAIPFSYYFSSVVLNNYLYLHSNSPILFFFEYLGISTLIIVFSAMFYGFFAGLTVGLITIAPIIYAIGILATDKYFFVYPVVFNPPVTLGFDQLFRWFCFIPTVIFIFVLVLYISRFGRDTGYSAKMEWSTRGAFGRAMIALYWAAVSICLVTIILATIDINIYPVKNYLH